MESLDGDFILPESDKITTGESIFENFEYVEPRGSDIDIFYFFDFV